jgi:hypothetical protein
MLPRFQIPKYDEILETHSSWERRRRARDAERLAARKEKCVLRSVIARVDSQGLIALSAAVFALLDAMLSDAATTIRAAERLA